MKHTLFLLFLSARSALGAMETLSSESIKAFFVYPPTHTRGLESSWIELRPAGDGKESFATIPLRDIHTLGEIKLTATLGGQRLTLVPKEGAELVLAEQTYKNHWFPDVEICGGETPKCHYEVQRLSETKELVLKITER